MGELRYVGKSLSNDNVYGKVTGQTVYCSDMDSRAMLHIVCCPGTICHGMIRSIDVSEAEKMPGVRKVYTFENTPETYFDRGRVSASEAPYSFNQEKLFDRHIRYYGERVAAVVAESVDIAEQACRKIRVEYDLLPNAISTAEAMAENAPQLHPIGNVYPSGEELYRSEYGDYEAAEGELGFTTETHIGRMTHLSMETQCVRAKYDPANGKLTLWSGCQTAYGIRSTVADYLQMPYSKVRVIKAVMGGSFGCKQEMILEPLAAYIAKDLKADVKIVNSREEQIVNTMMKTNFDSVVESKFDADGTIRGLSVHTILDSGAYQTVSPSYLRTMGGKLGKTYNVPSIRFSGQAVCTTTPCTGSFRSWGSSEAAITLEPHLNHVARKLGMDPIELRLKNVLEPYGRDVLHGASIENVRFRDTLIQGRERFDWENRKNNCRARNQEKGRYRYGVGMALCSHTSSFYPYLTEIATSTVSIQDDGSVIVHAPVHDHGCGTTMAMKKVAAEVLEIPLEKIQVIECDTENMPYDYGCYASRTTYVFGLSVKECAEKILERGKKVAAAKFGCLPIIIKYEDGLFYMEPAPEQKLTWKDVWEYSIFTLCQDLVETVTYNAHANPGTAAAHFTEVRVDTYTGRVKIEHCLSVHDIGKAINPDMCVGQVGSGIQQGIGMALCEEIKIDPKSGKTLITNLKNYEVANACEMPDYDVLLLEEEEPTGPYGAKGIGEVVLAPIAPAILEAVNFALGTNLNRIPLTPAVVMGACKEVL